MLAVAPPLVASRSLESRAPARKRGHTTRARRQGVVGYQRVRARGHGTGFRKNRRAILRSDDTLSCISPDRRADRHDPSNTIRDSINRVSPGRKSVSRESTSRSGRFMAEPDPAGPSWAGSTRGNRRGASTRGMRPIRLARVMCN